MGYRVDMKQIDYSAFDALALESRVWVYHSDRVFTSEETSQIDAEIYAFCTAWTSHNRQLKAAGKVVLDRIILLMVDESTAGASGCSIDSSVAFVKNIATKYQVDLFDRMLITYLDENNGSVHTTKLSSLSAEIESKQDCIKVFDNLVKTKADLISHGIAPIADTWVKRFI